ncbi:MAG: TetR/AcrR family transcriptional regulator [Actinomycetota bacterium]
MVQKEVRRGRPPKFDRDAVIAAAIESFFRAGYEHTTLADLEGATSVDRSTLYNSFGGKHGLYELAVERYLDRAELSLFGPLHDQNRDGYEAILDLFERLRMGLTSADALPGCLIVNDMAAGAAPEAAARYRDLLEAGLVAALTRAGHPEPAAPAAVLASTVIGVNLVAKLTTDATEIGRLIDGAAATVAAWRSDAADPAPPQGR